MKNKYYFLLTPFGGAAAIFLGYALYALIAEIVVRHKMDGIGYAFAIAFILISLSLVGLSFLMYKLLKNDLDLLWGIQLAMVTLFVLYLFFS